MCRSYLTPSDGSGEELDDLDHDLSICGCSIRPRCELFSPPDRGGVSVRNRVTLMSSSFPQLSWLQYGPANKKRLI